MKSPRTRQSPGQPTEQRSYACVKILHVCGPELARLTNGPAAREGVCR
jgi:hypothetical protein